MTDPIPATAPNATPPAAVETKGEVLTPAVTAAPPAAGESVFKVGGGTDCKRLAAAIANEVDKAGSLVTLEFIGAGACAQAVKAIAIANTFLSRRGKFVTGLPTFVHRDLKDQHDTTGMQIKLTIHDMR